MIMVSGSPDLSLIAGPRPIDEAGQFADFEWTAPAAVGFRTKVVRPRLPSDHVVRPRLHRLLARGLERRLILVSAPGGFGKSTLLSAWQPPRHVVAWVSLDEGDGGLADFALALVSALQVTSPGVAMATLRLLHRAELPSSSILAARLADDLVDLRQGMVIVLDDYHLIRSEEIHAFVERFLARLPENVHLAISAREDPPLPISTLRARGDLVEIRLEQLAFTAKESRAFLSSAISTSIDPDAVYRLAERTEGWAAGLRLAILATADASASALVTSGLEARGAQYAHEFLVEDVLAAQTTEIQDLLLRVSILERFCAPLLDALDPEGDEPARGDAWLDSLKRSNLFITSLDADGVWFRLHRLFRGVLRRRLLATRSAEYVATLHRRASEWFARQSSIQEAIEHALAAGDTSNAGLILEQHVPAFLDRQEDPSRLEQWLRMLPADATDNCPALLLARAWLLLLRNRPGELPPLVQRAEELLNADRTRDPALREWLHGVVQVLWSYAWSVQADADRMLASSEAALARVPDHWHAVRGHAESRRAAALAMAGRGDEARAWLRAHRASVTHSDALRLGPVLREQARLDCLDLRIGELARVSRELVTLGETHGLLTTSAWGQFFAGLSSYQRNELDEARDRMQAASAHRGRVDAGVGLDSVLGLAVVKQAMGDAEDASSTLQQVSERQGDSEAEGPLRSLYSLQARLALDRGDLDEAGRKLRLISYDGSATFPSLVEIPEVTRARWLLMQGTPTSLDEVGTIVDHLRALSRRHPHPLMVISADSVDALLLQARGDTESAIARLRSVLAATRGGDILRWFVDFGSPMQRLLLQLERWTSPADSYVTRVLAAFPVSTGPLEVAAPSRRDSRASVVDALTWRELEVLQLLDARMSNKEIARLLHISSETVKKHTGNIYQKLQVGSRREAVSRAHGVGLLRIVPKSVDAEPHDSADSSECS